MTKTSAGRRCRENRLGECDNYWHVCDDLVTGSSSEIDVFSVISGLATQCGVYLEGLLVNYVLTHCLCMCVLHVSNFVARVISVCIGWLVIEIWACKRFFFLLIQWK